MFWKKSKEIQYFEHIPYKVYKDTTQASMFNYHFKSFYTAKNWSFSLRISSVNVTKSAENFGFGHIYWRNP